MSFLTPLAATHWSSISVFLWSLYRSRTAVHQFVSTTKRNQVTVKDVRSLPRIDESLLHFFSYLCARLSYHRLAFWLLADPHHALSFQDIYSSVFSCRPLQRCGSNPNGSRISFMQVEIGPRFLRSSQFIRICAIMESK